MKMRKFLRRYIPAVMSLVIITALAAVSFAEQQAAKNASNEGLPEQASDKAKQKTKKQGEGSTKANHGHCVSYAAHLAKENGLEGSAKGAFISAVAQDKDAVTVKVAEGGTPDASCKSAIDAVNAGASTSRNKGKSEENRSDSEERGKSAGKGKSGS